jgi:hypothetical protein
VRRRSSSGSTRRASASNQPQLPAHITLQQRKLLELRVEQEEKLRSLRTYRWLSDILLGSIMLSVALMAVTVVFMLVYNDKNAAGVSSVLGLLSTFISSVIYQFIRYYRRGVASVPPTRRVQNS